MYIESLSLALSRCQNFYPTQLERDIKLYTSPPPRWMCWDYNEKVTICESFPSDYASNSSSSSRVASHSLYSLSVFSIANRMHFFDAEGNALSALVLLSLDA